MDSSILSLHSSLDRLLHTITYVGAIIRHYLIIATRNGSSF